MSDPVIKRLADALRMAEKAHAEYEKRSVEKEEWPEFYAQWLVDNIHLWAMDHSHCSDGSCSVNHADKHSRADFDGDMKFKRD